MASKAREAGGEHNAEKDWFAELISPADPDEFFASTWQQRPQLFLAGDAADGEASRPIEQQSWETCCDLLLLAAGALGPVPDGCDMLVFKDQELTHAYDESGPCAAILDGASCVVNHAEFVYPDFSELCLGLRQRLLHVYANSYITPARSQAVRAHADDRDVFILQLQGSKHWKVYEEVPIKLPYTEEQVGKNGLPVPERVFSRSCIDHVLQPGDVLYLPRGYVHEASCSSSASWHVTLAVATHDWSWAKALNSMAGIALDKEADARWRAAVPLSLGLENQEARSIDVEKANAELIAVVKHLEQVFDVTNLRQTMAGKLRNHHLNQERCIQSFKNYLWRGAGARAVFWRLRSITLDACVRVAAKSEKQLQAMANCRDRRPRGFRVRSEAALAFTSAMSDLRERGSSGMRVGDLGRKCSDKEASELFDDLSRICLARLCVHEGAFRIVSTSDDPPPPPPDHCEPISI